jgi:hypothetical protein
MSILKRFYRDVATRTVRKPKMPSTAALHAVFSDRSALFMTTSSTFKEEQHWQRNRPGHQSRGRPWESIECVVL